LTQGFIEAGMRCLFAIDCCSNAVKSHIANFGVGAICRKIEDWLGDSETVVPQADLVIGGIPCQGHSLLNKNRIGSKKRSLWKQYLRVVRRVRPTMFVLENVQPFLKSVEFRRLRKKAEKYGYMVAARVIDAADFGVAQSRKRTVIIASRLGNPAKVF